MADPYAGLGTPPNSPTQAPSDPYAGLGTPPARAPGATGFGALGQTVSDLFATPGSVTHAPNAVESGIMGLANSKPIRGMVGAYQSADQQGFGGLVARGGEALNDVGIDAYGALSQIKQKYPGQSDDFYRQQLHQVYNQAQIGARQDAAQQVKDNQYPGSDIVNFPAAVAGSFDPSWLYNPGAGVGKALGFDVGKTALSRIAGNIATHAVINSGLDSAYQTADILTGIQKDYDLDRNLSAAAFGGAFGGVHAGLSEVAPHVTDFVKGLFSDRNIDTTPSGNPLGRTTPITGTQPAPEVAAAINHAWYTGNEQDIFNAYQGTNITPPSHAEIHQYVQARDNPEANPVNPPPIGEVDQRAAVQSHVDNITQGWKNAPDVHIINWVGEIENPHTLEKAVDQNADHPQSLGFHDPDTGHTYIFANKIQSPEDVSAVLYHEGLGHFGLQQKFGDNLDSLLDTLDRRNVGQFGKAVDEELAANGHEYGGNRTRAAEEVLANMSEKGQMKPSLSDAVESIIRRFGRKMGMDISGNDAEVRNILGMAHDAVINGNGRDVRSNNFNRGYRPTDQTSTPLNQMFVGPKAANFDPQQARTMSDGLPRNEIDDSQAKLTGAKMGTLGQTLDHPELYDNYPHLRDLKVVHTDMSPSGMLGAYSPKTNRMYLTTHDTYPLSPLEVALHETQHAIQHHEGLMSPDDTTAGLSDEEYARNPREIEANLTGARQSMTNKQRSENPVNFMRRKDALSRDDDYSRVMEETAKAYENRDSGGPVSMEETRRAALDLGFKPSQIKDLSNLKDLNVRIARIGGALNMAKDKLADLNTRLDTPNWTLADKASHIETVLKYNELMARYLNDTTELGRAMNTIKHIGFTRGVLGNINDALREHGGTMSPMADDENFLKFARALKDQMGKGNDAATRVVLKAVAKPRWEAYLQTLWHNAMLSSLAPQFKASSDMITGMGLDAQERLLSYPIGKIRQIFGGTAGRSAQEAAAYSYGLLRSVFNSEALIATTKATVKAARTGEGSIVLPSGQVAPVSGTNSFNLQNPRITGGPNNVLGLSNKPTDLIAAHDVFFRSNAISGHLYDMAMRQAREEFGPKAKFDDVASRASMYAHNPTPAMLKAARAETDRTVLMNNNKLNSWVDKNRTAAPGDDFGERVGRFLLNTITPFIRPASNNLWSRFVMRSPLGVLDKLTRDQLAAGGKDADLAVARMLYGSVKMVIYWAAADKGVNWLKSAIGAGNKELTPNAPDNPDKRKELQAGGESFDAVKEGGQFNTSSGLNSSINPVDLHNNTASMVASMRDAFEQGASQHQVGIGMKLAFGSLMHDMASQTWLNDVSTPIEAATNTGGTAGQKVSQFATDEAMHLFPAGLTQASHLIDPNQHDTQARDALGNPDILGTMANTAEARIPWMSQSVPVRYSVYGKPLPSGASLTGVSIPNPITGGVPLIRGNGTDETTDPTELELQRLAKLSPAAVVTPVQRTVQVTDPATGDKTPKKLTAAEFEQYQQLAGLNIVDQVRQLMSSPGWSQTPDKTKIAAVKEVEKQVKQAAREQLFGN